MSRRSVAPKRSARKFELLAREIDLGLISFDAQGYISFSNPLVRKMLAIDTWSRRRYAEIFHDIPALSGLIENGFETGTEVKRQAIEFQGLDGSKRRIEVSVLPTRRPQRGKRIRHLHVSRSGTTFAKGLTVWRKPKYLPRFRHRNLLLQPFHQVLEYPQAILRIMRRKRSAFGMRHQAKHEAAFISNSGNGAGRTVRVARIVHGGPALFISIIEHGARRG